MATLLERLSVRSVPKPVGREAVSPLTEVDKILDCAMRPTASNDPGSENGAPNQILVKQYLVKWKGLSYLHCCWVPEQVFKNAYESDPQLIAKMSNFYRMMESVRYNGDHDFVAIRPEWTTVDQILASRSGGGRKEYLVKYKDLSYQESYWEDESDISNFQNEIQKFKDDRKAESRYWEGLVKEKYEVQQAREHKALGKWKRGCEQVPILEGEGESLRVLGFNKIERKAFELNLMRRGVGNFDWEEFVPLFTTKTYEEINNYGMLFLKHIVEDREDNSPTFSDGVPKGKVTSRKVLERIAAMVLVKEKCKFLEEHPRTLIFPEHIYKKYRNLKGRIFWDDEHDKLLLRGVCRHGYQNWLDIVDDEEFGIEELVSKELDVPFPCYGSTAVQQARLSESESSAVDLKTGKVYGKMRGKCSDYVRRRVHDLLVKALNYEFAEKYHGEMRDVQEGTKAKMMGTMEASSVAVVQEILARLPKTNHPSSMFR